MTWSSQQASTLKSGKPAVDLPIVVCDVNKQLEQQMRQCCMQPFAACRQEVEEARLSCGTTQAALQAARAQDELMASQLRAAKRALEYEKDETSALRQQV